MAKNPFSQWFWNDWVIDPNLRMCSMAAQGFWMQMLAIAAAATPRGYVKVGEKPCTIDSLAFLTGQDKRSVNRWVAELLQNGAASRDDLGIFCRRMVREETEEIRQKSARAPATLDSDSDSKIPPYPHGGGEIDKNGNGEKLNPRACGTNPRARGTNPRKRAREYNQNGVSEHHPTYGPLRDPVEIAKELGLRK